MTTREEMIEAIERAKAAVDADPTPETRDAYSAARTAYGDWMIANGAIPKHRGVRPPSKAALKQQAYRRAERR